MKFFEIFRDDNPWNEKTIIGFLSFSVCVLFAIADIVMGIIGRELIINDIIFNSFVIISCAALGIAEFGKIFKKR